MVNNGEEEQINIGIDILPQTSPSSKSYFVACIYDKNKDKIIKVFEKVDLHKLITIAKSFQAKYLASDNIYELLEKPSQIPQLCMELLPTTRLVQVTGAPLHGFVPLTKLMRDNGLTVSGKLTPLEAAKACAILVSKNLGYIAEPFEEETKIIVSRSRSKGPGGWSQARFGRLMDTAVKQQAIKIENQLIENKFDYDKRVVKSKFGARKVVFSVYAPISAISKIFKNQKGEECRVQIVPVNKERVEFIPLSQQLQERTSLKRLIVGIDPGLTIGLAIMDLDGKILKLTSFREASRGRVIREISKYGKPTLICTDVYPYPHFVERIASTLKAKIYTPRSVMTVSEKNDIARKLAIQQGVIVKNAHQRDALASTYRGYIKYRAEFEKIDKKYYNVLNRALRDEIKDLVVKGKSVAQAFEEVTKEKEKSQEVKDLVVKKQEKDVKEPSLEELQKQVELLKEQLEWERKKNIELYSEINVMQEKIDLLSRKLEEGKDEYIEELYKEKIIQIKNNEIRYLKEKVKQLEEELERFGARIEELKKVAWLRGRKGWIPLKVIKKFTKEEILRTYRTYGLGPGDTVYILDSTGGGSSTAELLLSYKIKAIIANSEQFSYYAKLKLYESKIPIAEPSDVEIIRIDEIAVIKESDLKRILQKAIEEIEEAEKEEKEDMLLYLIENYRMERIRELEEYDMRRKKNEEE